MIDKDTIALIFETARIDEVVGDFVSLKKRGTNYLGNCPFHNEKTPSFTVSPSKGIYKCFGCGVGGNSVNFIMEHEHYSYPEALRYLAKKYAIEIQEEELTPEMEKQQSEKESLYIVSSFAEQFFIDNLTNTEEGKTIGLSYFKERGFSQKTIEKFKLGYSPDSWDALYRAAMEAGYKTEFLEKTGLAKNKGGKVYDGYRGRVIFPIHNLSGRVIGFGGRELKKTEKSPKYVNTPECDIYHKSKVLYGMNFAKKSIVENNTCFLVEGYTDVISLHQSGIENVVASSGTSLTEDQIRLVKRFTNNITILYDGDSAGIKASFRGIDMILSEGMNVKIVLFPDGEDPDSYSKKVSDSELLAYIENQAKDFIVFKTDVLYKQTENDPIKKTEFVHEIINTISLIPDHIARSLYIKECSRIMDISERALINELNKSLRKTFKNKTGGESVVEHELPVVKLKTDQSPDYIDYSYETQERDIIRLLLNYDYELIDVELVDDEDNVVHDKTEVANYIINELILIENFTLNKPVFQHILEEYLKAYNEEKQLSEDHFITHSDDEIRETSVELLTDRYELANWESKHIFVTEEKDKLKRAVEEACYAYKVKRLDDIIKKEELNVKELQKDSLQMEALMTALSLLKTVKEVKRQICVKIGRPV